ncbi:HpaA family protein, partial [Weissella cibaria]|uniref:HpaA family protein n=1 Tax=Weissella cibaria TaxID=137591 RepID=UPI00143F2D3A
MAMMAAQGRSDYLVNLNELFDSNYKNRLTTSMVATFNEVLSSRGFSIMGPYRTFDDITYSDKKSAYLALVPTLFIYIDQKSKIRECTSRYCEDVGEFQISGELVLKLVEPMTQQAFMSKRINLSDLTTPRQYIKRSAKKHNSEGLIGSVI